MTGCKIIDNAIDALYKLFNEAAVAIKAIDKNHPVAICNGDLLFLNLIAEECKDVDILGTNVYRGVSFGDLFERVKKEYGKPVLFTEFGADAFNVLSNQEEVKRLSDQVMSEKMLHLFKDKINSKTKEVTYQEFIAASYGE